MTKTRMRKVSFWTKIQMWFHDHLDYGYPTKLVGGDGFQPTYGCRFCELEITMDSQGNWFHLSSLAPTKRITKKKI